MPVHAWTYVQLFKSQQDSFSACWSWLLIHSSGRPPPSCNEWNEFQVCRKATVRCNSMMRHAVKATAQCYLRVGWGKALHMATTIGS